MSSPNKKINKIKGDIIELIDKELELSPSLLGIIISTHDGTLIASKLKKRTKLTNQEIAAGSSSLMFLSSRILKDSLNQKISHNIIAGKETYILSNITDSIIMVSHLNRELAELEGLNVNIRKLDKFALRLSAIVETSDLIKEEIFVAIKRSIPNTLLLAIITKDGLPIKIQSKMPESMISAMISAIFHSSEVLLEENLEYSIISGEEGSFILHKLDKNRLLCVAVPEADESKLGTYIATIKTIIK